MMQLYNHTKIHKIKLQAHNSGLFSKLFPINH